MAKKASKKTASTALAPAEQGGALVQIPKALEGHVGLVDPRKTEAAITTMVQQGASAFDFLNFRVPAGGSTLWNYTVFGEENTTKELTGVLLGAKLTRAYWHDPEITNTPPDCSSENAQKGFGVLPNEVLEAAGWDAEDGNINNKGRKGAGWDCVNCPMAQFGSAATYGHGNEDARGQACKTVQLLALWWFERAVPVIVRVPPASLKNARQFIADFQANDVAINGLVVKLGLEKHTSPQPHARITFALGKGKLADSMIPQEGAHWQFIQQLSLVMNSKVLKSLVLEPADRSSD